MSNHLHELTTVKKSVKLVSPKAEIVPSIRAGDWEQPPTNTGPRHSALLLLNVQNDFMASGSLGIPGVDNEFVDKLNELHASAEWSLVMLSQVKHPNNHSSFASTVPASKPFTHSMTKGGDEILILPDFCVLGTHGAEFCDRLRLSPHDVVVETGLTHNVDDTGLFSTTGSHDSESIAQRHLARSGITDLFIAGADIDGDSILATLDEVYLAGIRVHVVIDLFRALYKLDDLWDVVHELNGGMVTVEQVKAGDVVALKRVSNVTPEGFRLDVFDKLYDFVARAAGSEHDFFNLVQAENANKEITEPHPSSGRSFVHYLTQVINGTATRVLKEGLDRDIFSICLASEIDCLTPPMTACRSGAFDNLNALLNCREQSAALELDASDAYGRSAMMYAVMRRDVELAALMVHHPLGGKTLLRAQDSCRRSLLLLACQYAGVDSRAGSRSQHSKGEAVLDFLWDKFQTREFSEAKCDNANWNFWNYAVKHNLIKVVKRGLQMLSSGTTNAKDPTRPNIPEGVGERRTSIHVLQQHGRGSTASMMPPPQGIQGIPGDLKVAFSKSKLSPRHRNKSTFAAVRNTTSKAGLRAILIRTVGFGMNLLHQATWQRREQVIGLLLSLYSKEGLLQLTNEASMSCLDLTADDVDPRWPFMLIRHGCVPKQTVGVTMYHMCIKALLLGEPDVVKNMVMSDDFGVNVDNHLLDIASRARFINTCTATFSSSTAPLTQLSFSCEECAQQKQSVVCCCVCAYVCHGGHKGVICIGAESFHCNCAQQISCACKKGTKTLEMPLDSVKAPPQTAETLAGNGRSPRRQSRRLSLKPIPSMPLDIPPPSPTGPSSSPVPMRSARMARVKTMKRQTTNMSEASHAELAPDQQAEAELQRLLGEMTYRDYLRHVFLMFAAKRGHQLLIEELVKYVKPDFPVDESLNRPLHLAARVGNLPTCILLKHNGGRVSVTNSSGETPLHIAAQYGHVEVCQLIAHNSNLLRLDAMALTPLHHAIRNDKPDVVDFIAECLRHKIRVTLPIDDMYFQATNKSRPGDKNACDASAVPRSLFGLAPGECEGHASPLHLAVRYGKVKCVSVLMRHGASPLRVDATGFSPYQTALWELYATRKRLEAHQEFLRRQVGNNTSERGRLTASNGKNFFRNLQESQGAHLEAQLEDLNKDLPADLQTLSPKVAHDLVDEMGKAPEVQRTRVRFAYAYLLKWVIGYLGILLLLLIFSLPRTSERFFITRTIEDNLARNSWSSITNARQAWDWLGANIVSTDTLLPPIVANTSLLGLQLFGALRIRQVRDKGKLCDMISYIDGTVSQPCLHAEMGPPLEETQPMAWRPPPVANTDNFNLLQDARVWRRASGVVRLLDYGSYSSDGYYMDIDMHSRTPAQNHELISALQAPAANGSLWFDDHTRFISIDYIIYNINFDTFCTVSLILEPGAAGELMPTYEILTHTLFRQGTDTYPSIGFEVAAILVAYFMISGIISNIIRVGFFSTLSKSGLLFDLAIATMAIILFVMDIVVVIRVNNMSLNVSNSTEFQGLTGVNQLIENQTYVIAGTILLMWLRLIKYSVLMPKFGLVTYAFLNTMKNFEVLSYLLFVLFVIIGFLCSFRLAFGQVADTATYERTLNLLMRMMMGSDWSYDVFVDLPTIVRTIFFIAFMVGVVVIFINLFISVLSEVYPREKQRAAVQCNDNLTVLIEQDCIANTHTILQTSRSESPIVRAFHAHVLVPVLASVSVFLRLFSKMWDFDIPETEFGWEKGREFHGLGLVEEEVQDDTANPQPPPNLRTVSVAD